MLGPVLTALTAFWLMGLFLLRSEIWLPWLALLSAIVVYTVYTLRGG